MEADCIFTVSSLVFGRDSRLHDDHLWTLCTNYVTDVCGVIPLQYPVSATSCGTGTRNWPFTIYVSLYRSQRARERNDTMELTVINVDGRTQLYSSNMGQSTFGFERLPRQISNQLSFYFIHQYCTVPVNHPSDGRKRAPNPPPDLFSKKSAESTEKYQYRLVSKSIMINRCRIIAWHAFFFFFLRTIDATTKRMRFPELHPIESNPHVSPPTPLHMLNGWQFCGNRLPRGFLGCVFAGPLPSSNDPFFRRRQSHPHATRSPN